MLVYREEIDGLRALAIVPVILYHAGFTGFFAGGYVGVDIFFVISGYLITSLIEAEFDSGTFSLGHFYERRCRRILPALFLIIFVSSGFAYCWMLPEQLKEFGQTLISIVTLSSNIFFWFNDDGYFVQLTELNPLVHTWSLAVEEQFYVIFPVLCYFLSNKKRFLVTLLACLALLSFFLAQWGGNLQSISNDRFQFFSQHICASFYLPAGRAWELLIGAFAAFYLRINDSVGKRLYKYEQFLSFLGLAFIIISVQYLDHRHIPPFPNCYTLLPTSGATLIILFGNKHTLVGRLLSIRPLRWLGLISYSMYLWHQPLLVFARLRSNQSPQFLIILIIISVVHLLSALSYFFIEKPFRNKQRFSRRQIFCTAGVITIFTLALAIFLIRTADNRSMMISKGGDPYLFDLQKYGHWRYVAAAFTDRERRKKTFSNETIASNRSIALIGDSFAQDVYNMIIEGKHLLNYEICTFYISAKCQIYIGPENRLDHIEAQYKQECTNANDIKYALPLVRQANIILFASYWMEWSARRLPLTLKLLNLTKQQQVFIIGAKDFGDVRPMLYVNKSTQYRLKQRQSPKPHVVKVNRLLEQTIDKSMFVNTLKMVCIGYDEICHLFTPDGKLISYDGIHLTRYGARHIGNIIFKNKPLNRL
ncbi:unnamed protein product [Rotaria magnacalcarata]|uniref:Acyltransferase n=1 Tax=Rotaria magnacalcarata TaxID=392030 RepID=A0A816XGJ7_9BILA|nr:unnamed protein product [Rotaria magnacalcarata]CAF4124253.1 unnamed protein product [Rotaria magnacalcarata]